jgi:hypothetical protein
MNEILGIEAQPQMNLTKSVSVVPKSSTQEKDIDTDYNYVRNNLYGIIDQGIPALDGLIELAKASEHPRAYEVVSQLSKTLVDANKDLLTIQKQVKELKTVKEKDEVTNNNLFVGSTSDLLKMIKQDGIN